MYLHCLSTTSFLDINYSLTFGMGRPIMMLESGPADCCMLCLVITMPYCIFHGHADTVDEFLIYRTMATYSFSFKCMHLGWKHCCHLAFVSHTVWTFQVLRWQVPDSWLTSCQTWFLSDAENTKGMSPLRKKGGGPNPLEVLSPQQGLIYNVGGAVNTLTQTGTACALVLLVSIH